MTEQGSESDLNLNKHGEVLVIGELNVDLIASGLDALPKLGQEVLASGFRVTLGSASAIFACGIAKLGHPVTFISRVGEDEFGRFCLNSLQDSGIATDRIAQYASSSTGVTVVLSTERDRAMVTTLGAIAELKYEQIPSNVFTGHKHLHLTSYFLQHGLRPDFIAVMKDARRHGLTVSFDPNSDPSQSWEPEIWNVLEEADVVFLNETEALGLSRQADLRSALEVLGARTACTVVKQGRQGATALQQGKLFHSDGFRVDALDTTGAGDSFAAGFIHGMLQGCDTEECLIWANAVGALSTLSVGGTTGQPDVDKLKDFLQVQHRGEVSGESDRGWPSKQKQKKRG